MQQKKFIKLFEEFIALFEKYEYGCSMLFLNLPEIKEIQAQIDAADLDENGLENEPHITLLYGIHDGDKHKELSSAEITKILNISKEALGDDITLTKISTFNNDNYDVLKFDVKGTLLDEINQKLAKFPNTNYFDEYHPHVTIAYLKKGMGEKYIKKFENFKNIKPATEKIVYSRPDGSKVEAD
jgi:2'-5' RNA ligase